MKLFMIAGELSGDRLGGDLMAGLRDQDTNLEFSGVGGPSMIENGLTSLFNMNDLSVMGLAEVLPKIPKLLWRVRQTARAIIAQKPDALITIDSPDFCFRVVAMVKRALPDIPVIHYVAPSVWAWRPERAVKMAKHVDHVLALLPFEPPYMIEAGMSCDFVGHPAAFDPPKKATNIVEMKRALGARGAVVTLLPGSRRGEIKRMMPIFELAVERILSQMPDTQFILPVASSVSRQVERAARRWAQPPKLLLPSTDVAATEARKLAAYAISDLALATSGTVALELAAADCPMVVAYQANAATTKMVKKMALIDSANLINIVTDSKAVPEFLFENCTPDQISGAVLTLLTDKKAQSDQRKALSQTMKALGRGDPKMKTAAAKSVLNFLRGRNGL